MWEPPVRRLLTQSVSVHRVCGVQEGKGWQKGAVILEVKILPRWKICKVGVLLLISNSLWRLSETFSLLYLVNVNIFFFLYKIIFSSTPTSMLGTEGEKRKQKKIKMAGGAENFISWSDLGLGGEATTHFIVFLFVWLVSLLWSSPVYLTCFEANTVLQDPASGRSCEFTSLTYLSKTKYNHLS